MFSRVVAAGQAQSAQHPGEECCPAKSLLWSGEMQTAAVKMRAPAEFYLFFFVCDQMQAPVLCACSLKGV